MNDFLLAAWRGAWMPAWMLALLGTSVAAVGLRAASRRARRHDHELKRQQAQTERARALALDDPQTALRNRASFQQTATQFIQRCAQNRTRFDLFYGRLHFPDAQGDELAAMRLVAERLQPLARPADFLASHGKTEFTLLRLREPLEGAPTQLHLQLQAACTEPVELNGRRLQPQVHIGIGTYPDAGQNPRELLMAAARSSDAAPAAKTTAEQSIAA